MKGATVLAYTCLMAFTSWQVALWYTVVSVTCGKRYVPTFADLGEGIGKKPSFHRLYAVGRAHSGDVLTLALTRTPDRVLLWRRLLSDGCWSEERVPAGEGRIERDESSRCRTYIVEGYGTTAFMELNGAQLRALVAFPQCTDAR